jgi:hypothetical protein
MKEIIIQIIGFASAIGWFVTAILLSRELKKETERLQAKAKRDRIN